MPKLRRFARSPYWYAEGRDAQGRRWSVSTKQTSRDAAARVARRIELERALPGLQPCPLAQTLAALVEHKQRRKVSAAELEIVRTKSTRLLEHWGPGRDCNTLTIGETEGYVEARRRDGISDATARKEIGKLIEALRLAHRHGRYHADPKLLWPHTLTPDEPRGRWLDAPEYERLLPEVPPQRRDYVIVYCHTGVRLGELYRIEAKHLDRDGMRVWVIGTKGRREHRERWVPLSPPAFAVLDARAKAHPEGPLFPARWLTPNMKLTLARACRRAGIEPVTANDLRRTFCTWCARLGVSERECQRFLGHSPASLLVRRVYAQLAPEAGRTAVLRFPGAPDASPRRVSEVVSQSGGGIGGLKTLARTSGRPKTG